LKVNQSPSNVFLNKCYWIDQYFNQVEGHYHLVGENSQKKEKKIYFGNLKKKLKSFEGFE
jgi:hypothetical protein